MIFILFLAFQIPCDLLAWHRSHPQRLWRECHQTRSPPAGGILVVFKCRERKFTVTHSGRLISRAQWHLFIYIKECDGWFLWNSFFSSVCHTYCVCVFYFMYGLYVYTCTINYLKQEKIHLKFVYPEHTREGLVIDKLGVSINQHVKKTQSSCSSRFLA